jgi:hypothetical protein
MSGKLEILKTKMTITREQINRPAGVCSRAVASALLRVLVL